MSGKFTLGNTRSASLTPVKVLEIREKYWQLGVSQGQLSREYGVTVGTIGRIVRGETWQHIGGPGTHPAASEAPAEQNLNEQAAELNALLHPASSAEIQASLAKLASLGVTVDNPPASEGSAPTVETKED